MKIPKIVVVSEALYKTVRGAKVDGSLNTHYAMLFLLGKNRRGTYTEAIKLRSDHRGCWYMPEVRYASLINAYMDILKKKLTPSGFALRISPGSLKPDRDVNRDLLDVPSDYAGQVFIAFSPEPSALVCTNAEKGTIKWLPVKIQ